MRDSALSRAIDIAGGFTKVARALNITPSAVFQWSRCPAERVLPLEALIERRVSRHELRPDLYPIEPAPRDARLPEEQEGPQRSHA